MPRSSSPWANLDRQRPVAKKFQDVVLNLAKTKDSSSHTSDFDKGLAWEWHAFCFTGYQNTKLLFLKSQATYFLAQALGSQSQRYLSSWFFKFHHSTAAWSWRLVALVVSLKWLTVSTWKKSKYSSLWWGKIHDAPLTLAMLHPTRIYNPIILIETSLNRKFRCSQQQMYCQSERNPINLTPNVAEPRGLLMVSLATLETSMLEWSDSPIRPMICKTPRTVIHHIPILYAQRNTLQSTHIYIYICVCVCVSCSLKFLCANQDLSHGGKPFITEFSEAKLISVTTQSSQKVFEDHLHDPRWLDFFANRQHRAKE